LRTLRSAKEAAHGTSSLRALGRGDPALVP
jgi:hypothetical protein